MINELNSTKDEGAEPAAMSVGIEPQAAPEETLAAASEPSSESRTAGQDARKAESVPDTGEKAEPERECQRQAPHSGKILERLQAWTVKGVPRNVFGVSVPEMTRNRGIS